MAIDAATLSELAALVTLRDSLFTDQTNSIGFPSGVSAFSEVDALASILEATALDQFIANQTDQQPANLAELNLNTAAAPLNTANPNSVFNAPNTETGAEGGTGNAEQIGAAVNNFMGAFNEAIGFLGAGANTASQQTATSLTALANANAADLAAIGITAGSGGALAVDQAALQNAIAANPLLVQTAFNGAGGFAAGVQTQTQSAIDQLLGLNNGLSFTNLSESGLQSLGINLSVQVALANGLFFNTLA